MPNLLWFEWEKDADGYERPEHDCVEPQDAASSRGEAPAPRVDAASCGSR